MKKTLIIIALGLTAFASGALAQYLAPGQFYSPSDAPLRFLAVTLLFLWYHLDSEQRGYRRSGWLNVAVVCIAVVALPYYLFRSRGARRGGVALLLALGGVGACWGLQWAGHDLVYYAIQR
ncbi:MAG: hypothetical protein P8076_00815 [Gammaproteobacteria bacterium]